MEWLHSACSRAQWLGICGGHDCRAQLAGKRQRIVRQIESIKIVVSSVKHEIRGLEWQMKGKGGRDGQHEFNG